MIETFPLTWIPLKYSQAEVIFIILASSSLSRRLVGRLYINVY